MFQKIKVLFYLLFYGLIVHSQNSLIVLNEAAHPFFLSVNHDLINSVAQSNVKAFNMQTGWNCIEIKIPGAIKDIVSKDSILIKDDSKFLNKELTYVIIEKEDKIKLHFTSISEKSGPENPPIPDEPKETAPTIDNSIYGNLYHTVNSKPIFYNNFDSTTLSYKTKLTDKDIKYALNLFKTANDNETAYRYLNVILENNEYTVLQLKELLESTPIDMDRLNSARKAYTHISDLQNINVLTSIFKYPTMKESYSSFIKEQENINKQKKMNCKEPINSTIYEDLFGKIKKAPYENDKLSVSKKLLVDVCLSSSQIQKISELFNHDREKLDFMKYAYNVLTDKEAAINLADEFQFKETKEEFSKYILTQK